MTPFKTSEPAKAKKFSHQQAGDVSITNGVLAIASPGFKKWPTTTPSLISAPDIDLSEYAKKSDIPTPEKRGEMKAYIVENGSLKTVTFYIKEN